MKQILVTLVAVMLVVSMMGCSDVGGRQDALQPGDTLYTEAAVLAMFNHEPERALVIIDSGVAVGNISEDVATLLRAKVFIQSTTVHRYDTAQLMLTSLLESPFVDTSADHRETILDLLVTVARLREDNVQYLRWATEKADFCR